MENKLYSRSAPGRAARAAALVRSSRDSCLSTTSTTAREGGSRGPRHGPRARAEAEGTGWTQAVACGRHVLG